VYRQHFSEALADLELCCAEPKFYRSKIEKMLAEISARFVCRLSLV